MVSQKHLLPPLSLLSRLQLLPLIHQSAIILGPVRRRRLGGHAAALAVDVEPDVLEQQIEVRHGVEHKVRVLGAVARGVPPLAEAAVEDGLVLERGDALGRGWVGELRERVVEVGVDPERLGVRDHGDGEVHEDAGKGDVAVLQELGRGRGDEVVERVGG